MSRHRNARPPQRPAPKVSGWGFAIIRACYFLTPSEKLVLGLLRELDNGDGAFMSPALLAAQLGMDLTYFKELRVKLQRIGLLVRIEAPGSRHGLDFWYVRLPDGFPSEPPKGSSIEDRRQWVREWANVLGNEVNALREVGKSDLKVSAFTATQVGKSDLDRSEIPTSPPQPRSEIPVPEVGKSDPSEHDSVDIRGPSCTTQSSMTKSCTTAVDSDCTQSGSDTERQLRASQDGDGGDPATAAVMRRWEERRREARGEA